MGVPEEMVGSTCMVSIPKTFEATEAKAKWIRHCLRHRAAEILGREGFTPTHGFAYDVKSIHIQNIVVSSGRLWIRLSAAAYNYESEFDVLRDAILSLAYHEHLADAS